MDILLCISVTATRLQSVLLKKRASCVCMGSFMTTQEADVPSEIVEDSKFVPLNEDDPIYGPPALLLAGFEMNEAAKIKQLLKDLDGDFLQIIYCTEDMISLTVWDAMHAQPQNLEALEEGSSLPRICIFSGLSGEEMMMFINAFPETGLAPAVFAALVPNSASKALGEVIDEIMGDHEMLSKRETER
ncbi:unnamed protein product [Spirodela intermedia]|uniref:Uncharacterized protein n=2 Tax=Spirodela intermedia TaxID=51605 RepID=A0A7I8LMW2_SPIIN|nr:unnamed protein product [Spirodela intermedia]CAA6673370.1 unnamed protein product [Spirodela intermedia]CAA7410598.1 unnamed protein product [Spirodela intermedia]